MINSREVNKYPYYFLLLYAVTYMANAIYNTFFPVYLSSAGFSKTATGTLLALGPFVAFAAQPIWGLAGDRAASKNSILKTLIIGSAAAILLYPLSNNFLYILAVIIVFSIFQSSIGPLSDAITLESLEPTRWKFSRIRLAGTLGFALMSVTAGIVARQNIKSIFILYFAIAMIGFFSVFLLPRVTGHQSEGNRVPIWHMFKNSELVILIAFNFIIQLTFGFYYSFFAIYYRQLGADNVMLGWAMFITSTSEIPFLLFADRILARLGIRLTLIASAFVISIRWLLLFLITDVYAILAINATHGITFIVFSFCLTTFISRNVPKELSASGQTMNALLCMGLARIIGSVVGGVFSDMLGIRQVFLYTSLIDLAAVFIFGIIFLIKYKKISIKNDF